MIITVDNPALPMGAFMNLGLGYLLGLGLLGYMTLWAWIKECGARAQWPQWFTNLLIGLHLMLGLTAVGIAPASVLHRLKSQGATGTVGAIAFLAAIVVVLCLGWLIARDWNRWYRDRQNAGKPDRSDRS
jgi:hypothetical protein